LLPYIEEEIPEKFSPFGRTVFWHKNLVLRTRLPVQLKALACFCLFGLWPKIQATRFTDGS
jgi:hypothetical protein